MKNIYFFAFPIVIFIISVGCQSIGVQRILPEDLKIHKVIFFNPEIFPDIEEVREPTYTSFYSAVSDRISRFRNLKVLRVDVKIPFDSVNIETVKEFCENNNADFAIVPKVKFFKVGIWEYVFSNQVIVSLKLYDAAGNFLTETNYDTYKKHARILGSAENSIKIGTVGAMKNLGKNLRKIRKDFVVTIEN
jgi:hypothetical protein